MYLDRSNIPPFMHTHGENIVRKWQLCL